jgi:hypothetical protein
MTMPQMAKHNEEMEANRGEIVLYQSEDGQTLLDVQLKDETVRLTQKQISALFGTERSVITKHINNLFRTEELDEKAVCAKFAHTAAGGKMYQVTPLSSRSEWSDVCKRSRHYGAGVGGTKELVIRLVVNLLGETGTGDAVPAIK